MRFLRATGWMVGLLASAGAVNAQVDGSESCAVLTDVSVPADAVRLPTGAVSVTTVEFAPASPRTTAENGDTILELAAHCRVQGEIAPVDPEAPPILFNVNLPVEWNGKALQSGGGGLGGNMNTAPGRKASGRWDPQPYSDTYPLTDGYATFGGDEGHQGGDFGFMYNDEALRNWASDAYVKIRDVAVRVIGEAYGRAPDYVYFSGESAGGREALIVAQRFPQAYDGVIAITPVLSWNYTHIADNNIRSKLIEGFLDETTIRFIADQTRAMCDADDGLVDGIIGRYMECRMDAQALRCPDGADKDGACLSDAQVAAVEAIREPWTMIVPMANGISRFPGYGVTGGEDAEENQWFGYMVGTSQPSYPLPPGRGFEPGVGAILNFAAAWVRHAIVQDETFEPHRFYPAAHAERIQSLSRMFDATGPDLSALRDGGGKLLILQQSADNAVSTTMVAEYYRSVVAEMGEEAAADVIRLYVGPGGSHNGNGVAQIDMLGLLEAWVENGEAPPSEVPVHDIDPATLETKRSMVACVYPMYTRYNGSGDINDPASYACTDRPDPLAFPSQAH